MSTNLKIFSGSANPQLATRICETLGLGLSRLMISRFSNDNLFVQIRKTCGKRMYSSSSPSPRR